MTERDTAFFAALGTTRVVAALEEEITVIAGTLDDYASSLFDDFDMDRDLADYDFMAVDETVNAFSFHLRNPPVEALYSYLALSRVFGSDRINEIYEQSDVWVPSLAGLLESAAAKFGGQGRRESLFSEFGPTSTVTFPPLPRLREEDLPSGLDEGDESDEWEDGEEDEEDLDTDESVRRERVADCAGHLLQLPGVAEDTWRATCAAMRDGDRHKVVTGLSRLNGLADEVVHAAGLWWTETDRLYAEQPGALGHTGEMLDAMKGFLGAH